jgi:hypothetical protein
MQKISCYHLDQQFQIQQLLGPQLITTFENHPQMELRAMGAKSLQD